MKRVGASGGRERGTRTSAFGSPGRVSHDSSPFYSSRLYKGIEKEGEANYCENPVPPGALDAILCRSSERMEELPDECVHLMVTSPPYNVGKEYDRDLSLGEYRAFLRQVWAEVLRVLVPGGRAAINIANLGRKPYLPLSSYILSDMLGLGYLMRGEIIWNKDTSSTSSTAWGTFGSARNPTLRDIHEYILVFSKGTFSRVSLGRRDTISREEFLEWTRSVWTFPAEPARRIGHPAPFPIELPRRLIRLYTFEGDVVLDPFIGSGQTALAALESRRHYIGYEINEAYVMLARKRIKRLKAALSSPKIDEFSSA